MRTAIFLSIMLTVMLPATAQTKLPEYKASNGITYHAGDTVKLGRGSATNGNFLYVQVAGLAASGNADENNLPRRFASSNAVIKKIITWKQKGAQKIALVVGVGLLTNYYLYIEDAIATCEVEDCKDPSQPVASTDKYDQLAKLKKLLDDGVITQDEYDKEKKKLLDQ